MVPVHRVGNGHRPYTLTDSIHDGEGRLVEPVLLQPLKRLAVRLDHKYLFVNTADIRWLEARGNYVRLYLPDAMYDLRVPLGALLDRLDPEIFVRVHRSVAANIMSIVEIDPRLSGRHVIVLCDGTRITTSRTYRNEMRKLLFNRR